MNPTTDRRQTINDDSERFISRYWKVLYLMRKKYDVLILGFLIIGPLFNHSAVGQYVDRFDQDKLDPAWSSLTGDGNAEIKFVQNRDYASIYVDATKDLQNIWWAVIRHRVENINMVKLVQPGFELRVEAKIRVSHAPRRMNLHLNHQRTTDYHSHLKEYDIPDTTNWHVVSMTTEDFEVQPDDSVFVQMALMDWGNKKYRVDVDYIQVDVVKREKIGSDFGNPLIYHPPLPSIDSFSEHIEIQQDASIDEVYRDYHFNNWQDYSTKENHLLSVSHHQTVIFRTDFEMYKDKIIKGLGLLELHLQHFERAPEYEKDFGMIRLVEMIGGKSKWQQEDVTYQKLLDGHSFEDVFNGQMIIDVDLAQFNENTVFFTLSEPVLNRLRTGKTKGLSLFPLGAIKASFYGSESQNESYRPKLHFNIK